MYVSGDFRLPQSAPTSGPATMEPSGMPGSQARVWPAAVVVTDPLPKNRANVPFAHRNHEVQAFAADCADHAFAEGIRLWRTHRCFQDAQAHRLKRAVNAF